MTDRYDRLLRNGHVVDPVNGVDCKMDVGIKDGKVADIHQDISPALAGEDFDLSGAWVLPGVIDLHVHASSWLGGKYAHRMMAEAGVTTALDMSGPIDSVLEIAAAHGAGLNLAAIQYVRPGHTVAGTDPGTGELEDLLADCQKKGAIGFKLLGGHYPLTPEATARAIDVAAAHGAYLAFHAGTLATRSNITGMAEAVDLIRDRAVHLAHINSYCRGKVKAYMQETEEAISALSTHPNICSESYLAAVNGTSAKCSDGRPESEVTVTCLTTGGFEASEAGLEEAILAGWAQINMETGGRVILAVGPGARDWWRRKQTDTTVSFQVNPAEPRIRLAAARRANGEFVVDGISTDGGGIPRNVTVKMGMALVDLQVLSIEDFVIKTSRNPARILGLTAKGHLRPGADADITVVRKTDHAPLMTLVNGAVCMWRGHVCGTRSRIITTPKGVEAVRAKGLAPVVVDPAQTPFCRRENLGSQ